MKVLDKLVVMAKWIVDNIVFYLHFMLLADKINWLIEPSIFKVGHYKVKAKFY